MLKAAAGTVGGVDLGSTLDKLKDLGGVTDILGDVANILLEDEGDNRPVWETHGGTDEIGNPIINIPNYEPLPTDDNGGGDGGGGDDAGGGLY